MPRALDHLVLAVRDLDAAATRFAALGFTVGSRNRHPWGTHNRIIQLDGSFIELITVAEPELLTPRRARRFSFGSAVAAALQRGEGPAMLALRSADAEADAERLAAAGCGDYAPFAFSREGTDAAGASFTVGFTLAFAEWDVAPDLHLFLCQQHNPERFWQVAARTHRNAAIRTTAVMLVAENPADAHAFLGEVTAQREMRATSAGVRIDTGDGFIDVLTPEAYAEVTGETFDLAGRAIALAGLRIGTGHLAAAQACLDAAGAEVRQRHGRLVLPAGETFGCLLAFEAAGFQGSAA